MDEGLRKKLLKLKSLKDSARSLLFVGSGYTQRTESLLEWLSFLEGSKVHPELGNALILGGQSGEESSVTSIKVDDVRESLKSLSLQRWNKNQTRYVLIPQAENLTNQAFNALLKSLEEPPEGTIFVLFSPARKRLLKTVLSRCIIVNLGHQQQPTESEEALLNSFFKAFFEKDYDSLYSLTKDNFLSEWQAFYVSLPYYFHLKEHESRLSWFDLFSYVEKFNQRLESNTDYKWLVADIVSTDILSEKEF